MSDQRSGVPSYEELSRAYDRAIAIVAAQQERLEALSQSWEHDAEHLYLQRFNDKSASAAFQTAAKQLREAVASSPSRTAEPPAVEIRPIPQRFQQAIEAHLRSPTDASEA